MSSIARWSYANVATVWPFVSRDPRTQAETFGAPYQIACTWISGAGKNRAINRTDALGQEYLVKQTFFTEDKRPKFRDCIEMGAQVAMTPPAGSNQVREVTSYDMSPFGEADSPDFEVYV